MADTSTADDMAAVGSSASPATKTAAVAGPPDASPVPESTKVVNVNVGVLGHVDSGKTSLVRALSTELSTAALDKHKQSKERGITLDLGFSAFLTDAPDALKGLCLFFSSPPDSLFLP